MKWGPAPFQLDIRDQVLTVGSCFAENMAQKLEENKFKVLSNPFGVLYNPISICKLLSMCLQDERPATWSYVENQEVHYNYLFHSDVSALRREELEGKAERRFGEVKAYLESANFLVLTWGTANVYYLVDNNELVGNCHKMPSGTFYRRMLEVDEIVSSFKAFYQLLKQANPNIKLIFTVSPVRHLKDGFHSNQLSKSVLHVATQKILKLDEEHMMYFPSYEIVMDELRDYRFYAQDLVHPNDLAVNHIWEYFKDQMVNERSKLVINKWDKVRKSLLHRPFYQETEAYKTFVLKTLDKLNELKEWIDVSREKEQLNKIIEKR